MHTHVAEHLAGRKSTECHHLSKLWIHLTIHSFFSVVYVSSKGTSGHSSVYSSMFYTSSITVVYMRRPSKRDNVVYWKNKRKIKDDLQ